jgi:glutathione S-transferase
MSMQFFYLSGSPFAWKVWLALERKRIDYDLKVLSLDRGDLTTGEFRAINPRGKVPAIVHDGFRLFESAAIVEYLEEAFPVSGDPLWPEDLRLRALGRRIAAETEAYLYPPIRRMVLQLALRRNGEPDSEVIAKANQSAAENLALLAPSVRADFILGDQPTVADFALYPQVALLRRLDRRYPSFGIGSAVPGTLTRWQHCVESLPYFDKTWPPHWEPRPSLTTREEPNP